MSDFDYAAGEPTLDYMTADPALDGMAGEPYHHPSHGGGPRTEAGKARSSMNSLKTGLTGRTVLLPTDDLAAYEQHLQQFTDDHQPVGARECQLVQLLADHAWRLMRIADMEMSLYAAGADDFSDSFDHRPPETRPHLIRVKTYIHHEKHFHNLHIQEMRIRRHAEKDAALLKELQRERLGDLSTDGPIRYIPTINIVKRETNPPTTRVPSNETMGQGSADLNNEFVFSNEPRRAPLQL